MLYIGNIIKQARLDGPQIYVAIKDVGEKQTFRLTPLLRFLPYYLNPTNVPSPDHTSGFAQELWIRNTF
jgi:hypothetical protein